jgi:hypothetical protein
MQNLTERALNAKRESKQIEFKSSFDPFSDAEWCEVMKDVIAIANSGGGIIVFGLNSDGSLAGTHVEDISRIDPADLTNKITKYTGEVDPQVEIREIEKQGRLLPAFIIGPAPTPLVFSRPGTYNVYGDKQKTAFRQGTVYFRHGAKSECGTTGDVRSTFERQLERIRKSWIKNVRRVVEAPLGSQVLVQSARPDFDSLQSKAVHVVKDPNAVHIALTRDPDKAAGTFMHEEVSECIFEEINNVVDANRVLAKGQRRFFLGPPVYYRVYAERRHIRQSNEQIELLFHSAISELYAPNLFWALEMDADLIAHNFATLYLTPKSPQIHWLMRIAILLGIDFRTWLYKRWDLKWHSYSQPPNFYFTFGRMIENMGDRDERLSAARATPASRFCVPGQSEITYHELLDNPTRAEELLSCACTAVFDGNLEMRSTARNLDYIAHGYGIMLRAEEIATAVKKVVGGQQPGDYKEAAQDE